MAPGSSLNVSYSDVQGGYVGTANINTNPLFIDTSYYLAQSSPAKDAGNPSGTYNDPLDTLNIPLALFPSRGTTANDMGAFGGPGSRPAVYVDLHLNDPNAPAAFTAYSDYQTPYSIKLVWTDPALKFDSSTNVPMTGKFIPKDTIALIKGWNMIGTISRPVSALGISTIPPSILRSAFYMFDSVYQPAAVLQPGRAYWIKSFVNGRIILNSFRGSIMSLSRSTAPKPISAAGRSVRCPFCDKQIG